MHLLGGILYAAIVTITAAQHVENMLMAENRMGKVGHGRHDCCVIPSLKC